MVAGGSAAIVGAAEDLGADARMVAFMQYLRLALVVLTMPLLVRFAFAPGTFHFALPDSLTAGRRRALRAPDERP